MSYRLLPAVGLGACCALGFSVAALAIGACSTIPHFVDDTGPGGQAASAGHTSSGAGTGGQAATTTGSAGTGSTTGSGPCTPMTCAGLGLDCGMRPDGCGKMLDCGPCPVGKVCGGAAPNKCGDAPCVPKTCATLGATCGMHSDGCSATLDCGTCTAPNTCGGGTTPNACGCTPTTCAAHGANCRSLPDGCGGNLDCGTCSGTDGCGAQGTANVCSQAILLACGGCPAGYGIAATVYNDICNPGAACGSTVQFICGASGATLEVTQNTTCFPGYHVGTFTPFCESGGNTLICVKD